ncbi:MAG: transcriptional regulator [Pseudomonas sp.]|nr:transcriptional regulator [Pseudomonas sp.]
MDEPSVLVLEDDDLLRMLVVEIIEEMGGVVTAFATADQGIIFLEDNADRLNLIISDVNMPGLLNGYGLSTIVALRWPSLPMILTSGEAHTALELGPNIRFLPKPWSNGALLSFVTSTLERGAKRSSR